MAATDYVAQRLATQIQTIATAAKIAYDPRVLASLVAYLEAAGTSNIMNLAYVADPVQNVMYFFDKMTGYVYPSSFLDQSYSTDPIKAKLLTTFGYDDRITYYVYCAFSNDGYPVFYVRTDDSGSMWNALWNGIKIVGSTVISYGYPALGATVGTAVCGADFAAAYPAIASAIGNAAISAALNGGDIQAAALNAVGSVVGNQVGGLTTGVTGSNAVASAAAAATKALVSGGDLNQAVAGSLLASGFNSLNASSLFTPVIAPTTPVGDSNMALGDFLDDAANYDNATSGFLNTSGSDDFGDYSGEIVFDNTQYGLDANGNLVQSNQDALTGPLANSPLSSGIMDNFGTALDTSGVPSASGVVTTNSSGVNLTNAALQALKLVAGYALGGSQNPLTSNATTRANPNGTLTQVSSTGAQVVSKMPVGTPYLTTNGTLVTNNGNGTYSSVSPTGVTTTTAYPATLTAGSGLSSLMTGNTPIILGVAVVALLLLSKQS